MTRFWLIRHGSHDWLGKALVGRAPGVALNAKGRAESAKIATALAMRTISAIYSSPIERAQETASPLAGLLGVAVKIEPALEEIDFGEWTGCPFAELAPDPRWVLWNTRRSSAACPGGETMRAVERRIVRLMRRLAATHPGEELALFSHGDVIRAALAHHLGMSLDLLHAIEFGPGAVALVEVGARHAAVLHLCGNDALQSELGSRADHHPLLAA